MGIEHRASWVRPAFGLHKGARCAGLFLLSERSSCVDSRPLDADFVAALIEAGANKQGVADALKFARIQRIPAGNSGYAR